MMQKERELKIGIWFSMWIDKNCKGIEELFCFETRIFRVFAIILCLIIAIPLAACNGSPENKGGTLESQ